MSSIQLAGMLHPPLQPHVTERVEALLNQMSLAEKIGQMTQVEKNSLTPADVVTYRIGSVLSGGGGNPAPNTPKDWADMVRAFQAAALNTPLAIPLLYGVDAVHGHNNVHGATIFPHNIGLGAAHNPELVHRIAQATTAELLATNVHWNFAPAVSVPQDIRWGRTYEGYSEQTEIVTELALAYARGLAHGSHGQVLASFKHFLADGGTTWGSSTTNDWQVRERPEIDHAYSIDQGDARMDEAELRAVHLPPYVAAIAAGALNIMISFSSWNGKKMHHHRYLLNDVLKTELGFAGFLVSDWRAINQIAPDNYTCVVESINAGLDMVMVPFEFKEFIADATRAVEGGAIAMARIDDAVRRILTVKAQLGLFETPFGDETLLSTVGCAEHRALAREAVGQTAVLLKNDAETLPLRRELNSVFVAGVAADDIGRQCGGWTIEWQGGTGETTSGTTFLAALQAAVPASTTLNYHPQGDFATASQPAQVGIVVLSELPYAEGMGDSPDLHLTADDRALVRKMRAQCERLVLILFSGRPLIITEEVTLCDAVVAAWLPGTEGHGLTDVILGAIPFRGKLTFSWPRSMDQIPLAALRASRDAPLFPVGYGLTTQP